MTTQPNLNAIRDAAADLIADTMYTYDGVERGTVTEAAQALQAAGLLADHSAASASTPEDAEPDSATLRLEVQDAGDRWTTQARFTHASPAELSDMVAAGAAQVIEDTVTAVVEVDPSATAMDRGTLALEMLHHITRALIPHTLDALPLEVRTAVMLTILADDDDDDDDDDTEGAGEYDD